MIDSKTIKLVACAPPRCSCPELIMDFDLCEIVITDDFGGKVIMTFEEFTRLSRGFLEHV